MRQRFFALMKVDDEVFGRQNPEAKGGIEERRRRR